MVEHPQIIRRQQLTNCLNMFGHFVGLALQRIKTDHMLVCDNIVSFEDFSVLGNGSSDVRIKLLERL